VEFDCKTHQLENVVTIANPTQETIRKRGNEEESLPFDYCIAIGQFENPIKQFDKLIVSYANSILLEKKYTFNMKRG
jgi:N-acetylgalactosamine-N,N'-diacetylbacillosaminyl-diphospho-undecaprenol 4-alpha-N-acetylgalactosaminyltransferase